MPEWRAISSCCDFAETLPIATPTLTALQVRRLVELMDSPDQAIADAVTRMLIVALWQGGIASERLLSAEQRGFLRHVFEVVGLSRPLH
jgi:hypothetical protein